MSVFTGKITAKFDLSKKLQKLQAEALTAQRKTVQELTLLVHAYAVESIQENGDGHSEIRYNPKRVVNVSDPGEPPNTDTGRLVRSIKFDFKKEGLVGRVGTSLKYGAHLEFGTKDMDARPWLSPAISRASEDAAEIAERNIKEMIRGVDG